MRAQAPGRLLIILIAVEVVEEVAIEAAARQVLLREGADKANKEEPEDKEGGEQIIRGDAESGQGELELKGSI